MGDDGKSLRKWCFTINNYIEEDEQNLLDELTPDKVVYAIVGREKGESGTPHLQGYVYFKRRLKMSTAKATLGKTARLEPARGTPEQNEQYCSKDGERRPNLLIHVVSIIIVKSVCQSHVQGPL